MGICWLNGDAVGGGVYQFIPVKPSGSLGRNLQRMQIPGLNGRFLGCTSVLYLSLSPDAMTSRSPDVIDVLPRKALLETVIVHLCYRLRLCGAYPAFIFHCTLAVNNGNCLVDYDLREALVEELQGGDPVSGTYATLGLRGGEAQIKL